MRTGLRLLLFVSLLAVALSLARDGAADPSASPSRGTIAFNCDLCLNAPSAVHWNGGRLRLVLAVCCEVRWNPNGRQFAYAWQGAIWTEDARSLARSRLTYAPGSSSGYGDDAPAWFPDGKRLLFVRAPKPPPGATGTHTSVWAIGSDGRGVRRLFTLPASENLNVGDPEISHDGRRIAFDDTKGHLWVTGQRGLTTWRLGRADLNGCRPRWSPDDTEIAYLDGCQTLAILDLHTNRIHYVNPGHFADLAFSWSPNGRWLAVAEAYDYDCNDPTQQCHTVQLWIVNATTGNAQRMYRAPDDSNITSVDWR
jgi:Tol biopolymer transport system component